MGRNRFVNGDVNRIELSDGDWIEVKKDLNTGDQKKLEAAGNGIPVRLADGTVHTPIDWAIYEIDRAVIFLTAWSFQDFTKDPPQPVALTRAAIVAMDPPDFEEMNKAIFNWVMQRAAEKNALRATRTSTLKSSPDAEPVPEVTSV